MEDFFCVAYQQTEDEKDLEYAFCGIYDGHGGAEAAAFAKQHLMEAIIKHKNFWSDNDEDVLRAIKDGYLATHYAMWKEQGKHLAPLSDNSLKTDIFREMAQDSVRLAKYGGNDCQHCIHTSRKDLHRSRW